MNEEVRKITWEDIIAAKKIFERAQVFPPERKIVLYKYAWQKAYRNYIRRYRLKKKLKLNIEKY